MPRYLSIGIILICVGLFSPDLSAQKDSLNSVKLLGLKVHQGTVLIHSQAIRSIRNSYPTGLELDLAWHKVSQQSWASCLCYPKLGVSLTFWDYDNPEILGQGITSMFYIEPVFSAFRRISISVRAGMGLSYQNRPYDPITNPDNQSYSTFLAFPLQLGGTAHVRLSPRTLVNLSAMYNHFSNGGIREPNKGINWPSVNLGVEYYLKDYTFKDRKKIDWRDLGPLQKRLEATFLLAVEEPESKMFIFSPGIEIKWSKQFARINAYTLGTEFLYDLASSYKSKQQGEDLSPGKFSLAVGHEFLLGRFIFSQQFGYYLYDSVQEYTKAYQRYGLIYTIPNNVSFGVNMKVHGHIANFVDIRAGYNFW